MPEVLYPAVQLPPQPGLQASQQHWRNLVAPQLAAFMQAGPLFVSINRFERKKVWPASFGAWGTVSLALQQAGMHATLCTLHPVFRLNIQLLHLHLVWF